MGYWPPPKLTPDTRTATFSLALDATTPQNGALKFIPGSQKGGVLRPHVPIGKTRDEAHAIAIDFDEANTKEKIVMACLNRGDVSIHDEYVVHGSGKGRAPTSPSSAPPPPPSSSPLRYPPRASQTNRSLPRRQPDGRQPPHLRPRLPNRRHHRARTRRRLYALAQ